MLEDLMVHHLDNAVFAQNVFAFEASVDELVFAATALAHLVPHVWKAFLSPILRLTVVIIVAFTSADKVHLLQSLSLALNNSRDYCIIKK